MISNEVEREIADLGRRYGQAGLAVEAITNGTSVNDFQRQLIDALAYGTNGHSLGNDSLGNKVNTNFHFGKWLQHKRFVRDANYKEAAIQEIDAVRIADCVDDKSLPQGFLGFVQYMYPSNPLIKSSLGLMECIQDSSVLVERCNIISDLYESPEIYQQNLSEFVYLDSRQMEAKLTCTVGFLESNPDVIAREVLPELGRQFRNQIERMVIAEALRVAHVDSYQPNVAQPDYEKWLNLERRLNESGTPSYKLYVAHPELFSKGQRLRRGDVGGAIIANGVVGLHSCIHGPIPHGKVLLGAFADMMLGVWREVRFDLGVEASTGDTEIKATMRVGVCTRNNGSFAVLQPNG